MTHTKKLSPLVGRGKYEQNRKNKFLRTAGHTALYIVKMKNKEEKARFRAFFVCLFLF